MILRFSGPIPISIYPAFWIFAALIGYLNTASLIGTFVWIGIILVSVLFHEFGHALTALFFKQKPRIELVALGGLTYHEGGGALPLWKQFFIVFNGPLFGFLLVIGAFFLLKVPALKTGMVGSILSLTYLVNLFWTVVNLLPVLPLDGGQLMRILIEKWFGAKSIRYAILTSLVIAICISLWFFVMQAFLVGAIFFLFAFQSYDLFRKMRHFNESDRNEGLKKTLDSVEGKLQQGKKEEAAELCHQIRKAADKGVIFETATQYLALLKGEKGEWKEVYQLLFPIRSDLLGDMLCLLQKAAFFQKEFSLVVELGGSCFQSLPAVDIALLNAYAHAQLRESEPAVGWLQTAQEEGLANLKEALANPLFDPIRQEPSFQEFLRLHQENG